MCRGLDKLCYFYAINYWAYIRKTCSLYTLITKITKKLTQYYYIIIMIIMYITHTLLWKIISPNMHSEYIEVEVKKIFTFKLFLLKSIYQCTNCRNIYVKKESNKDMSAYCILKFLEYWVLSKPCKRYRFSITHKTAHILFQSTIS